MALDTTPRRRILKDSSFPSYFRHFLFVESLDLKIDPHEVFTSDVISQENAAVQTGESIPKKMMQHLDLIR